MVLCEWGLKSVQRLENAEPNISPDNALIQRNDRTALEHQIQLKDRQLRLKPLKPG